MRLTNQQNKYDELSISNNDIQDYYQNNRVFIYRDLGKIFKSYLKTDNQILKVILYLSFKDYKGKESTLWKKLKDELTIVEQHQLLKKLSTKFDNENNNNTQTSDKTINHNELEYQIALNMLIDLTNDSVKRTDYFLHHNKISDELIDDTIKVLQKYKIDILEEQIILDFVYVNTIDIKNNVLNDILNNDNSNINSTNTNSKHKIIDNVVFSNDTKTRFIVSKIDNEFHQFYTFERKRTKITDMQIDTDNENKNNRLMMDSIVKVSNRINNYIDNLQLNRNTIISEINRKINNDKKKIILNDGENPYVTTLYDIFSQKANKSVLFLGAIKNNIQQNKYEYTKQQNLFC